MIRPSTACRAAIAFAVLAALLAPAFFTADRAEAQGGSKRLMSERMAVQDMKRMIVETIIGYKVQSQTQFGLTETPEYKADVKAQAIIKDIQVDQVIYDAQKDIALAIGYIDLNGVIQNVLGERLAFKDVRVEGFGFGTTTESSRPPLMALRAALVNAYEQMGAALLGEKMTSRSVIENGILSKDSNQSRVAAAVYGAYIPYPRINDAQRGWGWDDKGIAFVKLEMDARKIRDLMGNVTEVNYENIISVTGHGAQVDEVAPQPQSMRKPAETMSLGVPTQQAPADMTGKTGQ